MQKVLWAADECALPYTRQDVGGAFGGNDQPWYRALNPNGVVPTIDDAGYVLWESNSIVRYLAASYGPPGFWPTDPKPRGHAERWMDWQLTTIQAGMTTMFWGLIRTPAEQRRHELIAQSVAAMEPLLARMDEHLARHAFMGGGSFTMADIPLGCEVHRWFGLPQPRPVLPHLERWFQSLCTRGGALGVLDQPLS